jgi:thiol-disulfide isomerase/thioredoxin
MIRFGLALVVALGMAGFAAAEPPTEDQLKEIDGLVVKVVADGRTAMIRAAKAAQAKKEDAKAKGDKAEEPKDKKEARPALEDLKDAVAKIKLADAPLAALDRLSKALPYSPSPAFAKDFQARVAELAKDESKAGAAAAALAFRTVPRPRSRAEVDEYEAKSKAAVVAVLKHPGLKAGLASKDVPAAFLGTAAQVYSGEKMPKQIAETLAGLATADAGLPSPALTPLAQELCQCTELPKAERERVRLLAVAAFEKAFAEIKKGGDARRIKSAERQRDFLNGPSLKGELIGYPAPATHFLWSNDSSNPKSLADFKGKVVVIDFWATWCGPCIGSFPKIKEMQEHYEGSPVVIVSLTSPQGYVSYPKAKTPAERRKDATEKEELELLGPWAKEMDMTWTVVCGKENCFNPDFGVNGIPHMAIIAPDGTVRFNGVNFRSGEAEPKIDALLKEFKLPLPKPAAQRKAG